MRRALAIVGLVSVFSIGVDASGTTASRIQVRDDTLLAGTPSGVAGDGARDSESAGARHSGAIHSAPSLIVWPCRLLVAKDLREFAELAWRDSATFRDQCRKLGAARAVLIVRSSQEIFGAEARIGRSSDGATVARVRVRRSAEALEGVELIAHELEHVLEHVEGVKLLLETRRAGSGVSLSGGTFETKRAIDTGRRVAQEVRAATRAPVKGQ
jgi:hypothetical protein